MKLISSAIEEFKIVFVLCDQIPELEPGTHDEFYRCEAELSRLFPVVDHQTTYTIRFAASREFLDADQASYNQVRSSDDFFMRSSQFRFVSASSGDTDNVRAVSFGVASTFGLHDLTWNQQDRSFIEACGNIARVSTQLVTAPLPAHEQWVAVSAFRSAEYSHPLRIGDVFLLRSVGHQIYVANLRDDHIVLRN